MSIIDANVMTDLKGFIDSQRARAAQQMQVDWGKRRDRWLQELDALFSWIRDELLQAGLDPQAVTQSSVSLHEEKLGRYDAPSLSVQLPTLLFVDFKPKASVIIGGYGRVDVQSRHALTQLRLIALDANDDRAADDHTPSYEREWTWWVFPAKGTTGSYLLERASLGKVFTDVTN